MPMPPAPAAARHGSGGSVGPVGLISENLPMSFDPNKYVQNAKDSHILWVVAALYLIYYWDFIVTVALIFGALWLLDKWTGSAQR